MNLHPNSPMASVKNNDAVNKRSTRFKHGFFNQDIRLKKEYKFKTPTPEELEASNLSNKRYLRKQRRTARVFLILGVIIGLWIVNFFMGGFFTVVKSAHWNYIG